MGKFKVGDKVEVINDGAGFTTYDSWVEKFAPEYLDEYVDSRWLLDGDTGEIVAMGEHESFEDYGIIYLIKSPNKITLIGERGIELVEKGEDKMETYLIEDVINMLRKNPDKKFTYDSAQDGSYITVEGDRVVWRGNGQEGQVLPMSITDKLWCEFHQKSMTFKEICELVEEKGIKVKVKVVHEDITNYNLSYFNYFDDILNEMIEQLSITEMAEVLLHGKWYWRLVN